jgi:serine phosphatase RsbU (regulator of sigma subunit)
VAAVRISFRTRLALAFVALALTTAAILLHLAWRRGRETQLEGLRSLLLATSRVAAGDVDGDAHAAIPLRPDAAADPRYRALKERLLRVKAAHPDFQEVYTLSLLDPPKPGWGRFVASDTDADLGRPYDLTRFAGVARALTTGAATDDDVEQADAWGRSMSGYSTIRDGSGRVVGLLGIDVQDTTVAGMRRHLLLLLALAAGGAVCAGALLAWWLASRIHRPVALLSGAVDRVAAGDYDSRVAWPSGDEFERLCEAFNGMAAGLEERRRLKNALLLAMEIQRHLLPSESPAVPGLDLDGAVDYCDETGGDYFDFPRTWTLPNGRVALTVGDVTGHGIGAALLMATARAVLRSHADEEETPERILPLVNRALARDATAGKFMTLFYGVLDPAAGRLVFANAGQGGCFVVRADGRVEDMPACGPPLGVVPDLEFPSAVVEGLRPGDVVAAATDGTWEAQDRTGGDYGMERVFAYVRDHRTRTAREIARGLLEDVRRFRDGAPQTDDITIVVARLAEAGALATATPTSRT